MTTTSDSVTIEGRLVEAASDLPSTFPRWIQPALHVTAGRDPISLQTITIDRIMPRLAPALLALSRRARYFSIYPFLLDAFQTHRGEPTRAALSRFIKQREFDLAVAMQICPNGCGSKPSAIVGQDRAGPAARTPVEELPRGESVQSELGGYGLYYRTPLIELGLVAPAGTPFGPDEELTPVDILANERARLLASRFRCAIENTRYYREFFRGIQPSIPREVLAELADVCCLCKLGMFPEEQAAIRSALLEAHDDVTLAASAQDVRRQETEQRRRSVALVLWAISREPSVATGPDHEGAFRRAIWQGFEEHQRERTPLAETLAQWAALIAKDVAQEALSSMWSETCRRGFATQPSDGMTRKELERFIREDLAGQRQIKIGDQIFSIAPNQSATELDAELRARIVVVPLEEIRTWVASENSALAGVVALLLLRGSLPDMALSPDGWKEIGTQSSAWQPGLLQLVQMIEDRLEEDASVADLVQWLVTTRVLDVHQPVAYSKLPEFTFRFRREFGRLRFYDLDPSRFGLTDIRREAITRITRDLDLWNDETGLSVLTPAGTAFLGEVLG